MSTPRAASEPDRADPALPIERRRGCRRAPASALAHCLCVSLALWPMHPVRAQDVKDVQDAEARAAARGPQAAEAIASVVANGVARGEFRVVRRADGDFWFRAEDLARLDLRPLPDAARSLDGEAWYSARSLGARSLRFDEVDLTLDLDFRADALPVTRIDLSNRPPPMERSRARDSLVLSYRLTAFDSSRGRPEATALADLNVRVAGLLLRQEMRVDTTPLQRGFHRGATQAIWDDLQRARRLAFGDVVSSAGSFGTTITGAGVLFAKVYDLAPDLIREPTASFRTSTTLPADVEVSVDGTSVYRGRVAPGPIALDNLVNQGGTRSVRVVITDAAGRREVIDQSFLFTDSVLARGLHEYSYFAGRRSELGPDNDWHYREPAWQAWHRYGATDALTIAAGGEGSDDFRNVGAGITLRGEAGLFSLDLLGSRDRVTRTQANGWSGRYTYQSPYGAFILGQRQFGPGFRSFATGAAFPFPRSESRIGVATTAGRFNLSADMVRTVTDVDVRDTAFFRAATTLTRAVTVFSEVQTTRIEDRKGWALNVYLRADFDRERWNAATYRTGTTGRSLDLETGKQLPDGEGLGYRAGTTTTWEGSRTRTAGLVGVDWNLRPFSVGLFASTPVHGDGSAVLQADLAGALVGLGGYWGFTRQVTDSFALARLGVPQPGVEIFLNNQTQGRTDDQGRLLIPQISSYGRQLLTLNEADLGIQYSLPRQTITLAPAFRSGNVVDFGIARVRAIAGQAWVLQSGQRTPVVARSWEMAGAAGRLAIATGGNGDFYVEDTAPGHYTGTLQLRERKYACRLDVPDFAEPVHELKEGIVCE